MLIPLPIDPLLPRIVELLQRHSALVISALPGAGKTTRVPRALYEAGLAERGDILVLEPRRLAARLAAARVAEELGEEVGRTVGYSMRFETVGGNETRVRFLTEGVLSRRIVQDPGLAGVSVVVLDEFHERHLVSDLALAFLRKLQIQNHRLKLVVMSATLDADPISAFLEAPVIRGEGLGFEVEIEYESRKDERPLHEKVGAAVARLVRAGLQGHVLVFLPGAFEIRRAAEALEPLAQQKGLRVIPLHGDLPVSEQSLAVRDSTEDKLILATNVAETSITIPGVTAVIDSGLARIARHSAWSGLPTIAVGKISKASANQRAGRAGRTCRGRVVRLYSRADYDARPEQTLPEIMRADLSETVLTLHGAGVDTPGALSWFEPPPRASMDAAVELLARLGALDGKRRLTGTGRRMLHFPVHPRLARLIVEGERLGVAEDTCAVAALLSQRDIRLDVRGRLGARHARKPGGAAGKSDLTELLDLFKDAEMRGIEAPAVDQPELDPRAVESAHKARRQLSRLLHTANGAAATHDSKREHEEALLIAILTGFPDRVARRRAPVSREILLAAGGSAVLSESSVVHHAQLMVAVDAEERKESIVGTETRSILVRLASAIEPEWLAALFPDELIQSVDLIWNDQAGRVEERRRTCYGEITLEEILRTAPPSAAASSILAGAVLAKGPGVFRDRGALTGLQARLSLLEKSFPEEKLPVFSEAECREIIVDTCAGKRSIEELERLSLADSLIRRLSGRQKSLLFRETPESVDLPRRKNVRVHYESAQPPWIESRLQDFLGMKSAPVICGGQVRLTVHLLAPNGRAVQVTQDLAGFWIRHYPAVRRELQRRYPRHVWPDPKEVI